MFRNQRVVAFCVLCCAIVVVGSLLVVGSARGDWGAPNQAPKEKQTSTEATAVDDVALACGGRRKALPLAPGDELYGLGVVGSHRYLLSLSEYSLRWLRLPSSRLFPSGRRSVAAYLPVCRGASLGR